MKTASYPLAFLGAGLALLFAGGYVLFGPKGLFGIPEPEWAQIVLWPGIYVGVFVGEHLSAPLSVCYAAGIGTMTVIGGIIGAVLDFFVSPRDE